MDTKEYAFLKVIEAGSLKSAAEQLNTDPSSVSRKVSALEARLGVKLLQRSTKKSIPTEAGTFYYQGMREIADTQLALETKLRGEKDEPTGLLRIAAPLDFGTLFITPVLKKMLNAYPNLNTELVLGSQFEDITSQNIDVAIRIGRLPDSSLICKKLGDVSRVLVASRSYVEQHGKPALPSDLAQHEFIFYSAKQARSSIELNHPNGNFEVEVKGRFTINSVAAVRDLVEEGHGIHLGPVWAFRDGLEAGRLVPILPEYKLHAYPLHALYTASNFVPAKVKRFIEHMAAHASSKMTLPSRV